MKTWAEVKTYIQEHGLSYKVERYNMSNRGTLVGLVSGQPVAYSVKDAARLLRAQLQMPAAMRQEIKTPGQLAYERDLLDRPNYRNGLRRDPWEALPDVARWSWERNPTTFAEELAAQQTPAPITASVRGLPVYVDKITDGDGITRTLSRPIRLL